MRLPEFIRKARIVGRVFNVKQLLAAVDANPKTAKSAYTIGMLTAPMHLAPAKSSGAVNVCPYAGACEMLCLDEAGNPLYASAKKKARKARTLFYKNARAAMLQVLIHEIAAHIVLARRVGLGCAVRLNATSDILWERFAVTIDSETAEYLSARIGEPFKAGEYANLMELFPRVSFYDYSKVPPKHRADRLPANYSLTYSYDPENDPADMRDAIARGWNVAVPVQVKRGQPLPESFTVNGLTLPAIDGDLHDYRPADPRGVFVLLRFKRITGEKAKSLGAAAASGEGFALPIAA